MNLAFNPPAPILILSADLQATVKQRAERNLCKIIAKLSGTVFYSDSLVLQSLRSILGAAGCGNPLVIAEEDEPQAIRQFRTSVPFTTYDDYLPYVSKVAETSQARLSDVRDLLAPGLPIFVAHSSGTSGAGLKYFLKYPNPRYIGAHWDQPGPHKITMSGISAARLNSVTVVVDDDGELVNEIPITTISNGGLRAYMGIGPRDDDKIVSEKAEFLAVPFAVWLLPSYKDNIYMSMLFSLMDASILFMSATISTVLYDAIRILEEHWEEMIQAIETGGLPIIPSIDGYRVHLERHMKANASRANDLRAIPKGQEGWLKKIWPGLATIIVTISGPYAACLPQLRHHFGSTVSLQSAIFGATEGSVGFGYDANDTNLYRLDSDEHIEFLDAEKGNSTENLLQPWEVESGKRYEIVMTNNDGLWRYTLNDIVEIAGFSPTDGQPLIRFVERKGVAFRVWGEFVAQSLLADAVMSLSSDNLGRVLEFTTILDERKDLRAYGFLIELDGIQGENPKKALDLVKEKLLTNEGYKKYSDSGFIGDPTIRVVAPGTFKAYREWKLETSGISPVQIKVPVAVADTETKDWVVRRVIFEVERVSLESRI